MGEKIMESSKESCLYFEVIDNNEIVIGVSETVLGTISSVTDTTIIKTGGVDLTTVLVTGMAIKLESSVTDEYEIRRVDYVEDSNTVHVTRSVVYTSHTGENLTLDFWSNDNYGSHLVAGEIERDNFENTMQLAETAASLITFDKCTEFSGMTSLFVFDDAENFIDRQESFITGTYDIELGDEDNLLSQFIIKPNRKTSYIVDMEDSGIVELDDSYQATISGLNDYIYKISCNGFILNSSQWTKVGTTITITDSDILQTYTNYINVLHYPDQTTKSGYVARFNITYFDQALILTEEELGSLYVFEWYDNFSSQSNPDYYDYRNRQTKQNEKIKINSNNKLRFSVKTGLDTDNLKNIVKHINQYLINNKNFRLIRYVRNTEKFEYYWNCRKTDGSGFNEDYGADTYEYSIDYLRKSSITLHYWGDEAYKWGSFDFGILSIVED